MLRYKFTDGHGQAESIQLHWHANAVTDIAFTHDGQWRACVRTCVCVCIVMSTHYAILSSLFITVVIDMKSLFSLFIGSTEVR